MPQSFFARYRNVVLWILFALLLPLVVRDEYYLMILTLCLIWAILASSLNLILGFTGQASLAQGAFFGIGAYAISLLMIKLNLSFWTALPVAIAITGFFGFFIGLVALRTSGAYFAICTMMFNIIVTTVIITFLMEYFQTFVEYATLMMGVVLLIFIIYLPGGIIWGIRRLNFFYQAHRKKEKMYAAT